MDLHSSGCTIPHRAMGLRAGEGAWGEMWQPGRPQPSPWSWGSSLGHKLLSLGLPMDVPGDVSECSALPWGASLTRCHCFLLFPLSSMLLADLSRTGLASDKES